MCIERNFSLTHKLFSYLYMKEVLNVWLFAKAITEWWYKL